MCIRDSSESYQSEAELEKEFIRMLTEQGYEYLPIHKEQDLVDNLRRKVEELNDITFSGTAGATAFNGTGSIS